MSSPSFLLTLSSAFQTMHDILAFSMDCKWSQPSETILFNKWHFSMSIVQNHAFLVDFNKFNLYVFHSGCLAGLPKQAWQSVLGAALSSYNKSHNAEKSGPEETSKFLHLAKRYRSSSQVLSAVADYLDSVYG